MSSGMTSSLIMIAAMFALMYFLLIRPEKKRKQQAESMRNALKKGDTVLTIGGIMGKVVSVTDSSFVLETSEDRVRVEFSKWALNTNVTQQEAAAAEAAAKKEKGKKAAKVEAPAEKTETAPEAPAEAPAQETGEEK